MFRPAILAFSSVISVSAVAAQSSPLICEDSINNQPPFDFNDVPCLLGCGTPVSRPTGSLLPGAVNLTDIPYCRLNCVRKDATPAQSSAAPSCNSRCENGNSATPDQLGWCMYWCVAGDESVVSTTCIPELQYTPVSTTTLATYPNAPDEVATIDGFTQLPEWSSWYQTQTVISRSCNVMFDEPSSCMESTTVYDLSFSSTSAFSSTTTGTPAVTSAATISHPSTSQSTSTSGSSTTLPGANGEAEAQSTSPSATPTSTSAASRTTTASLGILGLLAMLISTPNL